MRIVATAGCYGSSCVGIIAAVACAARDVSDGVASWAAWGLNSVRALLTKGAAKGDWEGDTVAGKSGRLVTVVDRKSRYVLLAKVPDKRAASVNRGGIRALQKVPDQFRKTLTLDNGTEFARFGAMERALGLRVYFAEPYHSNQRATNENTNSLLRQYFPKGTDFREISHQAVAKVQQRLNNRPRKCLGYRTPHEVLFGE